MISLKTMFRVIKETLYDFAVYFSPKTKIGRIRLGIVVVLLVAAYFLLFAGNGEEASGEKPLRTVTTAPVTSFSDISTLTLIGTVESVDQAVIETEASGRITSVNTDLGESVSAGSVIATLENASERAAVLQAEGAYEAALAAAAQSDISTEEAEKSLQSAKNTALNTVRSAFITAQDTVLNSFDQFYGNPENVTPGLRIGNTSYTSFLNNERVSLKSVLANWQQEVASITSDSDLAGSLSIAEERIEKLIVITETFITIFNDQDTTGYTQAELATFSNQFTDLSGQLNATLSTIENATNGLASAEATLERVNLGGTGGDVSAANAQVKQALGSLRAAQANLSKTIIRTPITGVVNALSVKVGDYVSNFSPVATIANNNALEITTFVGDADRSQLTLNQPVTIEGNIPGTIVAIAPAVDPATRKVEIKISTESDAIANGDTVDISLTKSEEADTNSVIVVPLTAVKFSDTDGFLYTIEDSRIKSHPVELGQIYGSVIEVLNGAESNMEIVVDARGLSIGQQVEAITQ